MEQQDRGAQNAYRTADYQGGYCQERCRSGYLSFQSRAHCDLKHMQLGLEYARYIVYRPFNQGRPVRVGRETDIIRRRMFVRHRVPLSSREDRLERAKPSRAAITIGPVTRFLAVEPMKKPMAPATQQAAAG